MWCLSFTASLLSLSARKTDWPKGFVRGGVQTPVQECEMLGVVSFDLPQRQAAIESRF